MNERIRELAEQATSTLSVKHEGYGGKGYTEQVEFFDKEKFAELIVRECAELCTEPYHCGDAETGTGFGVTAADIRCEKLIKRHFGVEE